MRTASTSPSPSRIYCHALVVAASPFAALADPTLSQTLKIDEVRLKFATAEGEQIWFTSGSCTLAVGETPVTLFCPVS